MARLATTLGTDLPTVAKMLQAKGRGKDRVLAHITAEEARLLKARGGRGSYNPTTGLLEFDDTPETVNVTAPAPAPPAISAPPPTFTPSSTAAPPTSNNATETVTSTAKAPAGPAISVAPSAPAPIPMQTSQLTAATPPAPAAPAGGNAAPETVTVPGTQTAPAITAPTGPVAAGAQPGQSTSKQVKDWLGNNSTLLSILGLGGLGAFGAINSNKAAGQATALQSNLANLAAPLTTAGTQELNTTLGGGLTPQNLQALQAVQAQLGQSQAMGAVSSQQVAQSISGTFATLLNNQLQQALSILQSSDTLLQTAYLQGYQAQQTNQTNTTNFYTNLAQLAAQLSGLGGKGVTVTVPGGTA